MILNLIDTTIKKLLHPNHALNMLLHLLSLCGLASSQYICNNFEQCASEPSIQTTSYGTEINCFGYRSCISAGLIESKSGSNTIECGGSYSCYNSSIIIMNRTDDSYVGYIFCHGFFSCANVNQITNTYGIVYCDGSMSCYNSSIYLPSYSSAALFCDAFKSCADSDIYSQTFSNYYFDGYLSGENSVIQANGYGNPNFVFRGANAGSGATVICATAKSCTVACYGNSCNNLTLECENGDISSCSFGIFCIFAMKSDICPNGYDMNLLADVIGYQMPFIGSNSIYAMANGTINFNTCDDESVEIHCNDYSECDNQNLDTRDDFGSICCTASDSCSSAVNISARIDSENHSHGINRTGQAIATTAIRCDG